MLCSSQLDNDFNSHLFNKISYFRWRNEKLVYKNLFFPSVLSKQDASQVLVRKRRAYSMFEETKKGNLERECIEELCNKEEAREIFENDPETVRMNEI